MSIFNAFKKTAQKAPTEQPAPVIEMLAEPVNRRQVSGDRVLCRCSLELPKPDQFSNYRARCEGYMVMNVRGGSLYIAHQLAEKTIAKMFPAGKPALIKDFKLYTPEGKTIPIGNVHVRFLKLNTGVSLTGLVLRFVKLSEQQIDILNVVAGYFPKVEGREELAIPVDELHRL